MQVSFRDPHGQVYRSDERVLRFVNTEGTARMHSFLSSGVASRLVSRGSLVKTEAADLSEGSPLVPADDPCKPPNGFHAVFRHERIEFPNFPYEWSPEMLHDAARLTLEIVGEVGSEGFGLKDATPENIIFRGCCPVFVDLLSFETRHPNDPTWLPYAQFVRTFLLPLLVNKYIDVPLNHILLNDRDGLTPEAVYEMCGCGTSSRRPPCRW